jgi:hypothetical protein
VAPEVPAARVADRPAQRRVAGVAGVVIAGVQLHPVPVRVAQVDVEGIGHAVPARPPLDQEFLVQRAEYVADPQDLVRLVDEERHVVQPRSVSPGERHVVHGLLAEHPGGVQGVLVLDRLGQAEAERGVVLVGRAHVPDHDVEVVEPGRLGPAAQVVALLEALRPVRFGKELHGEAERVLGPDRLPHAGCGPGRDPRRPRAEACEERLGQVQVGGGPHPVGQPGRGRLLALAQDQAVLDELVVPAQVERPADVGAHREAEQVHVEPPGLGQVGDDELGVGRAHDVRGCRCLRIRCLLVHGQAPNRGTRVSPSGMWTIRDSV